MAEKILSVFIDESGDFGPYDFHAPFYLVAMVLHNQDVDISKNIDDLENHLTNIGYKQHAIHTGPLIRRESVYAHVEFRKVKPVDYKLFQAAGLICTMELLAEKAESNSFSRSEQEFFCSVRDFKKNYLKPLLKKHL